MNYPELVKQTKPTTCGQCCIATILHLTEERVIEIVGHDGIMTDEEMINGFHYNTGFMDGHPVAGTGCIGIQKHKDPKGTREHWTVFYADKTLDPACIGSRLWPVYKHMVVDWL